MREAVTKPAMYRIYIEEKCIFISNERAYKAFCAEFREVEAAGGLVASSTGEYLMIFRGGLWDLPKGHREAGENLETTALREVSEETGLPPGRLSIDPRQGDDGLLCVTDHCYVRGGVWHLKHTYWYAMQLKGDLLTPVPQTEEGISQAVWTRAETVADRMKNAWSSIREVMAAAGTV